MVFSTTKKNFGLKSFKKNWANKKKLMDTTFFKLGPPPSFFLIEIMVPFSYHGGGEGGLSDAFFGLIVWLFETTLTRFRLM